MQHPSTVPGGAAPSSADLIPTPAPIAPPEPVVDYTHSLDGHLKACFPDQHHSLLTIRSGGYGGTYIHCRTARYITEMCVGLGMGFGRNITPAVIEGMPFEVLPKHVAACFGVNSNTFGTMRTTFTACSTALRLLAQQPTLSLQDTRLLHILQAMLRDDILDAPSGRNDGGTDWEAATVPWNAFRPSISDAISRHSPEASR